MYRTVNCTKPVKRYKRKYKNVEIQSTKIQNCSNFGGIGQQQLLLVYRTVKCTKPVPALQWPACAQLTAIAGKELPSAQNPLKECTKGEEEA